MGQVQCIWPSTWSFVMLAALHPRPQNPHGGLLQTAGKEGAFVCLALSILYWLQGTIFPVLPGCCIQCLRTTKEVKSGSPATVFHSCPKVERNQLT